VSDELLGEAAEPTERKTKIPREKITGRPKGSKHSEKAIHRRKVSRIVELTLRNVPQRDIALAEQVSPRTVANVLEDFKPVFKEIPNLPKFKECKADLLDAALLVLLKSMMQQEKLEKASVNNLAYAAQQMYTMARLERGQSTSNNAVVTVAFTKTSNFKDTLES
jgi:hypothetical protein